MIQEFFGGPTLFTPASPHNGNGARRLRVFERPIDERYPATDARHLRNKRDSQAGHDERLNRLNLGILQYKLQVQIALLTE